MNRIYKVITLKFELTAVRKKMQTYLEELGV